jgi:cyclopropane fatty-acyl-phospholipid synthase-like methyltransferase
MPFMDDEQKRPTTIDRAHFRNSYAEKAPWDIGRPQPAFLTFAHMVVGSVLDAGCGTGEHALFFAAKGHEVTGFDFLEEAIAAAKRKAAERGLTATFLVQDALKLQEWPARFDNVIDSGLFHVFSDEDRAAYVAGLGTVLKRGGHLLLLCFSDQTPGTQGPRRLTQEELRKAFSEGWEIKAIEPARLEVRPEAKEHFSGESPRGWLLFAQRTA